MAICAPARVHVFRCPRVRVRCRGDRYDRIVEAVKKHVEAYLFEKVQASAVAASDFAGTGLGRRSGSWLQRGPYLGTACRRGYCHHCDS